MNDKKNLEKMRRPKPSYPLELVQTKLKNGEYLITSNALQTAWNDFGWEIKDIVDCLLKLNNKYHEDDPEKNHFYKADRNLRVSKRAMDFYKAKQIMEERDVYTHLYINEETGKVIISSFKEL
ncbi:MAG: type II toxin-antitoxin system MqsR family toxin [Planctomycetota bacterium]